MSRRIGEDFAAFGDFLQKYNLNSFNVATKEANEYKAMHKKLYGLLIFVAEFSSQGINTDSMPFFEELSSDLLLSLFCSVQGMYKPAKLQLRCSIENFIKALVMISTPDIIEETRVFTIFDIAKNDKHFITPFGAHKIEVLQNDYSILCRTVHGDPSVMYPTSALALLPQYNDSLLHELSDLYIRIVENYLGLLYINYPIVVGSMHPDNNKDFLDCMSKSTKSDVIKVLFG